MVEGIEQSLSEDERVNFFALLLEYHTILLGMKTWVTHLRFSTKLCHANPSVGTSDATITIAGSQVAP